MGDGHLKCCWSSISLRKEFGVGYAVEVFTKIDRELNQVVYKSVEKVSILSKEFGVGYAVTIEKVPDTAQEGVEVFTKIDRELNQVVYKSVEKVSILSHIGHEITFQLPVDVSKHFVEMFHVLHEHIENGKLVVFSVSVTTLQDVFLMLARGENGRIQKYSLRSSAINSIPAPHQSYGVDERMSDSAIFLVHTKSFF
eukprot:CAMPEP_0198278550 /NCGR_PEP_ID=MMETSP1447-20131203/66438_1 /TAXON_ID=420782 /ORGANISM="Chaetoceros dichaeta, Strain CCMP1751" /LENGTH=196 /DNA_ID=CAMNT_0043973637 /DNA_START=771 /DNA_END=1358 /DNA_ORIENTATION=+